MTKLVLFRMVEKVLVLVVKRIEEFLVLRKRRRKLGELRNRDIFSRAMPSQLLFYRVGSQVCKLQSLRAPS